MAFEGADETELVSFFSRVRNSGSDKAEAGKAMAERRCWISAISEADRRWKKLSSSRGTSIRPASAGNIGKPTFGLA